MLLSATSSRARGQDHSIFHHSSITIFSPCEHGDERPARNALALAASRGGRERTKLLTLFRDSYGYPLCQFVAYLLSCEVIEWRQIASFGYQCYHIA